MWCDPPFLDWHEIFTMVPSKLRKSKDGGSTPGYEGVNKNKEGIVL